MSKTIDERVVSMQFDNKHFESNVRTTMSTLDKLKQSLNFKGSAKGLEDINTAASKVNMTGLGKAVDTISMKFSALEVMGVTALANITNSAVNAGKRMVSALTIDPIKTGLQEYETQINATQTILANTKSKGSTIEDVNNALQELNEYADLTIYNFTEMTRNIGTFTAAGIDLETSVSAIQGIANLAAVSGSTSQQASTAMYQLSQALATGTVKLMDWNSVVNAGMGGEMFQEALKETSRELKTGADAAIKAEGSFRESLRTGWLTSEVLTETLKKFTSSGANEYVAKYTGLTVEAVEAALEHAEAMYGEADAIDKAAEALAKKSGKNKDEIKSALEFAKNATDAATKVKTFTQLWDVMKESAQSGWAQTWKLLIGDFEEAKALLTPLADFFTGAINAMSEARNKLLESALGKGFTDLAKKVSSVAEPIKGTADSIGKVVDSVKNYDKVVAEIIGGDWGNGQTRWDKLTEAGYDWAHAQNLVNEELGCSVRHATTYAETQKKTTETQNELNETEAKRIAQLAEMSDEQLKALGYTKEQIQAFRELKEAADKLGLPLEEFLSKINEIDGRWLLINSFKNVGQSLVTIFKSIGEAWRSVFDPITSDQLFNVIAGIHRFSSYLVITDETAANLKDTFAGLFAILDIVSTIVGGPIRIAFKIFEEILKAMDLGILDVTAAIGRAIVKFSDWVDSTIESSGIFEKIADYILDAAKAVGEWIDAIKESEFIQDVIDGIKTGAQGVKDALTSIGDTLSGWRESIKDSDFFQAGKDIIQGLIDGIKDRASTAWDTIVNFAKSLITKFCEVLGIESPSTVFFAIGGFIILGLIAGLKDGLSSVIDFFKNLGDTISDFFSNLDWVGVTAALRAVAGLFPGAQLLNIIANFTYLAHTAGDELAVAFEKIGGYIPEGLAKGIKGGVGAVWDTIVSFATSIIDKVCEVLGIESPSKVMMVIGGYLVLGLIMGLKNEASSLWDVLKNGGSKCIEIIQTFAEKILEMVKALDLDTVISVGMATGLLLTLNKIANVADKFATPIESIGGLFKGLKDTVTGIGKAIKTQIKVQTVKVVAEAVVQLAIAIGILAASLWLISKIDPNRLWPAFGAIAALSGIVLVLTGVIAGIMVLANKIDGFDGFAKVAVTILSVSASLLIIAGVLKLLSTIEVDDAKRALGMLAGVVASMVLVILALSKLGKTGVGSVAKVGAMMIGVSTALILMVGVVKIASKLEPDEALKGLAFVLAVELLFIALIAVSKLAGNNATKAGAMLLLMSIAFAAMIGVVKMASKLDPTAVEQGLGVVKSIGLLFTALIAVSALAGKNAGKAGVMLLGMAAALGVTVFVIEQAGQLTDAELKRGIIVISVLEAFCIALVAVSYFAGEHADKAGKMLLAISAALLILTGVLFLITLMTNDPDSLRQAVAVVAILETLMMGLIAVTKLASGVKTGPLLMIALAVSILSGVLIALSVIDPPGLAAATASISTIMAMLGVLIASTNKAGTIKTGTLIKLLGVVIALSAIVGALAKLEVEGSVSAALAIGILLAAMSASLMMLDHVQSISTSAIGAMYGLIAVIAALAVVLAYLSDMPSPANTIPIVTSMGILLNAMAASLMILDHVKSVSASAIGAMAGLTAIVMALALVLDYLSNMESPEAAIPVAVAIGVLLTALSASVLILSKVGLKASMATSAIAPLMKLTGALVVIITALGLLSKIPGFDEVIRDGGEVLGLIGVAIGKLVGGLVGGFAAGALSTLPEIGTYLSDFMTNVTPFIEGVKNIDESVTDGAVNIAKAVAALAVADFINGCATMMPYGSTLPQLGTDLSNFITNVMPGLSLVKSIDPSVCDSIKALAETMLILTASNLLDGVGRLINGDASLVDFGKELASFGPSLAIFAESVSHLDDKALNAMEKSATAGKLLAEMAATFPNSGGWLGKIMGENDADDFGKQLEGFGKSLVAYGKSVEGIDKYIDSIEASIKAGESLAALADAIPDSGGFIADFLGDNTMDDFGTMLEGFGASLMAYGKSVEGIDAYVDSISSSVEAGKGLAELAEAIPNSGGFIADFFGDNSVDDFGNQLKALGEGLKAYGESVLNIGTYTESIEASSGVIDSMVEIFNKIRDDLDFDWGESEIDKLGNGLTLLATGISDFTAAMTAAGDLSSAEDLVENAVGIANYIKENLDGDPGKAEIDKLSERLTSLGTAINSFYTNTKDVSVPAAAEGSMIDNVVDTVNYVATNLNPDQDITAFGDDLARFGAKIAEFATSIAEAGDLGSASSIVETVIGIANKIKTDLTTEGEDVDISDFGNEIAKFGKKIAEFAASITETGDISGASTTVDNVISIFNKIKGAFSSSEEDADIDTICKNISDLGDSIAEVTKSMNGIDMANAGAFCVAVDSLADAATKLSNIKTDGFTKLGENLESIGKSSIRKFASAFNNSGSIVTTSVNKMMDRAIRTIESKIGKVNKQGVELIKALAKGIKDTADSAVDAAETVVSKVAATIGSETNYSSFYDAGLYLGEGLVAGIEAKEDAAYDAGYALGQAAVQGEKDGQASNSPSKLTIQAGNWLGEGLVIGIKQMGKRVYNAGSDLGSLATKTISDTVARVAETIDSDIDAQPTIRPVLDLSDVSAGANTISSMFGNPAVGVTSNIRAINSMMNNQNGGNDDVVSAINKLRKDLGNVGNTTYSINGITYDDEGSVSDAIETIVRAARMERRV